MEENKVNHKYRKHTIFSSLCQASGYQGKQAHSKYDFTVSTELGKEDARRLKTQAFSKCIKSQGVKTHHSIEKISIKHLVWVSTCLSSGDRAVRKNVKKSLLS